MTHSIFIRCASPLLAVLALVLPVLAHADITVAQPWVRATVPHQPATGAFLELRSDTPQRLVAAESPVARTVELHEMRLDNDIMRMRQVPFITLPAGQAVALQPGGYHIMLIGLHAQVQAGQQVPLNLVFEAADGSRRTLAVQAEVRALGAAAPAAPAAAASTMPGHSHSHSHSGAAPTHGHGPAPGHAQPNPVADTPLPASVTIAQCWVRALPPPLPSAAYFELRNGTDHSIRLTGVSAPGFGHVMLHSTENRDGMATMVHLPEVAVAPGNSVAFAPGGLHVMLEQPQAALTPGTTLPLSFQVAGHTPREVMCEVRSARG